MGDRANYVVIAPRAGGAGRGGKTTRAFTRELYYAHWGATTLVVDLFWGPDVATAVARAQERVSWKSGWLDTAFGEAGAVIDFSRSVLTIFGGQLYARATLALLRAAWAAHGWHVEHATRGMLDVAIAAGADPSLVTVTTSYTRVAGYDAAVAREPGRNVICVRGADGVVRELCTQAAIARALLGGEELLADLAGAHPLTEAPDLSDTAAVDPCSAAFIDVRAQSIDASFYLAADPGVVDDITAAWPGWRVSIAAQDLASFAMRTGHVPSGLRTDVDWVKEINTAAEAILAPPVDHSAFLDAAASAIAQITADAGALGDVILHSTPSAFDAPSPSPRPSVDDARAIFERARAAVIARPPRPSPWRRARAHGSARGAHT